MMIEIIFYFYLAYAVFGIILSFLQISHIKSKLNGSPLFLNEKDYKKAGEYAIENEKVSIFSTFVEVLMLFMWLFFGLAFLEYKFINIDDEIIKSTALIMSFLIIGGILSLPFDIYSKFFLDKRYGFTKNLTIKTFISDLIKSTALFIVIGSILIYAMSYFISTNELWWIISFAILFTFIILINIFYPIIRGAFFDKFKPLENEDLKTTINDLLSSVGFKSSGVFSVDASKRDSRLNAYFGGLGKTKRVVLFDTLIEKLTKGELISVLGHELGHFKNKDIIKNIASMSIVLFATFYLLGQIPQSLALEVGVSYSAYFIISMFLLLSPMVFFIFTPIMSLASRHNEFEADKFGINKGSKEELASALIKLINENLSFPSSHKLYSFIYHSHPSVKERLEAMGFDDVSVLMNKNDEK
jgi:STE24 endopeptidase